MLNKLATCMANYFSEKGVYSNNEIKVYTYGFELLLSTILNGLGILLLSLVFGKVFEAVLFICAFIPLRVTAGGYHANHHWSCFLTTNITYLILAIVLYLIDERLMLAYTMFAVIITSVIIWILSPMEAVNKPLSLKKKEKLRERSILIVAFNLALVFMFVFIPKLPMALLANYLTGALAAGISLIAAFATRTKNMSEKTYLL